MSALEFVKVRTDEEIRETAELASGIWTEYYTPILGKEQVEYMVTNFQSAEAIKKNLGEGWHYRYFLLKLEGRAVGYFAFTIENGGLFLSKMYVKKELRGHGVFSQVMEYLTGLCGEYDLYKIWLTVNRTNSGAIAAYKRLGFAEERAQVTDIGGGFVMDDYVMIKNV